VLRGFALFGILLVNMPVFAWPVRVIITQVAEWKGLYIGWSGGRLNPDGCHLCPANPIQPVVVDPLSFWANGVVMPIFDIPPVAAHAFESARTSGGRVKIGHPVTYRCPP
jgi:hypothetical protein